LERENLDTSSSLFADITFRPPVKKHTNAAEIYDVLLLYVTHAEANGTFQLINDVIAPAACCLHLQKADFIYRSEHFSHLRWKHFQ
jgi:hypothetical protein